MFYIIGDIHGRLDKLDGLYRKISSILSSDDILIFLGDYIDRGPHSFEVIEYLLAVAKRKKCVFLKGNHEDMFMEHVAGGGNEQVYLMNGGDRTIRSYRKQADGRFTVPRRHLVFFSSLGHYFEGENFIAVHAGLNPKIDNVEVQSVQDMLWIRDGFYRSPRKWAKTVIFGHTPTMYLSGSFRKIFRDPDRNIIGIDTGAVYGGVLSCLAWPGGLEYQE